VAEATNTVACKEAVQVALGKRQLVSDAGVQSPIRPAAAGGLRAVPRIGVTPSVGKQRAEKKSDTRRNNGGLYGLIADLLLDVPYILGDAAPERVGQIFDLTA
jgi:hypothetical protein